jgi:hypothetical protein
LAIYLFSKQGPCDRFLFFSKYFSKNGENSPPKNHWLWTILFFKKCFFIQSDDCPIQRCRKGDDHPEEDLAKYGYQTSPKKLYNHPSKSLTTHSKTNKESWQCLLFFFPSLLAIENLRNHFIFKFFSFRFRFRFLAKSRQL